MQYLSGANIAARAGSVLRAFFVIGVLAASAAAASAPTALALAGTSGSEVQVSLCAGTESPDISLLNPKDGALLTSNPVFIKAAVNDLAQAKFYVDTTLLSTITLGQSATDFQIPLSLPSGNHTIKVVTYDMCNREFATVSLMVTMRQPVQASSATSTSSKAGGTAPAAPALDGDVVVYHDTTKTDKKVGPIGAGNAGNDNIDTGGAPNLTLTERLLGWLNLGQTFQDTANFTRATSGVVGAVLALYAPAATAVAHQAMQSYLARRVGTKRQKLTYAKKHMGGFRLAVQGIGVVLLTAMFVV